MNKVKSCSFIFVFLTFFFLIGCESSDPQALSISPSTADFEEVEVDDDELMELTVTNISDEKVSLEDIHLLYGTEFEIYSGDNTPINLEPNEKHIIFVAFKSHATGTFTDRLIIKSSASPTPKRLKLYCTCIPSTALNILEVAPSTVNFGDVNLGDSSKMDVTLTNKYNKDMILTSCVLTGSSDFVITAGDNTPFAIVKDATHKLTIQFMPTSIGTLNAQIEIRHDASSTPVTIDVKGNGVPVPIMVLTETSYDFGNKLINGTYYHDFEIENVGTAEIVIAALNLVGTGASAYAITNSTTPFSIQPGSKHTISVSFNPPALGDYEAELRITHNAINEPSPYSIDIKGFGALSGPNIAFNYTNTLDFGNVSMSSPSYQNIEVRNIGTDPVDIPFINLSMGTVFQIESIKNLNGQLVNLPYQMNPGDKLIVKIKFSPTSTTTFNDTITIAHAAINEPTPYDIKLTGVGTN